MPYAQIHTQAPRHPKLLPLSDAAWRLWATGLCYVQEHLTDGHISAAAVGTFGVKAAAKATQELLAAGLWHRSRGDGYLVHDYADWNHTRQEVAVRQAARKVRWQRWREKQDANASQTRLQRDDQRVDSASPSPPQPQPQPQYVQDPALRADASPVDTCGKPRNGRRLRPKEPASVRLLTQVVADVLRAQDGTETEADVKEDVKRRCAALHLDYSSETVRKALDGARALLARQQAVRA